MVLKLAISLLILLGTLPIARADDASKRAKVNELLQVMNIRGRVDRAEEMAAAQGYANVSKLFVGKSLTVEQKAQLEQFHGKFEVIIANAFSWEKLEPLYAKIYADTFTEQEIDDMIAFYKTPTGKAVIEKRPMLQKQIIQIVYQRVAEAAPEIRQASKDLAKQMSTQQKTMPPKTADQK